MYDSHISSACPIILPSCQSCATRIAKSLTTYYSKTINLWLLIILTNRPQCSTMNNANHTTSMTVLVFSPQQICRVTFYNPTSICLTVLIPATVLIASDRHHARAVWFIRNPAIMRAASVALNEDATDAENAVCLFGRQSVLYVFIPTVRQHKSCNLGYRV